MSYTIYTHATDLSRRCLWDTRMGRLCGETPRVLITVLSSDLVGGVLPCYSALCTKHASELPENARKNIINTWDWPQEDDFLLDHDDCGIMIQCSQCIANDPPTGAQEITNTVGEINNFVKKHMALHDPRKLVVQ